MKRHIIHKDGLEYIGYTNTHNASDKLAESIIITNEILTFKKLPYVSLPLNEEQVKILEDKNIYVKEEHIGKLEYSGGDYEKIRSFNIKNIQKGLTGVNTTICILDGGCNVNVVPVDLAINFIDAQPGIPDNTNHGTFVTSIVRSLDASGNTLGLAPGCTLWHFKIGNSSDVVTETSMLAALDYLIDDEGANIINMSFNYLGMPDTVKTALQDLYNVGTILVAAAGNSGNAEFPVHTNLPAALPNVIAVNSVSESGQVGAYSVTTPPITGGHGISIAASGVQCQGLNLIGGLELRNGTSFSAPFFCGAFALYQERYQDGIENYTNQEVVDIMLANAVKQESELYFGAGLITF